MILINTTTIVYNGSSTQLNAGDTVTDTSVIATAEAEGAVFGPPSDANLVAAQALVQKLRGKGRNEQELTQVMLSAYALSAYTASSYSAPYSKNATGGSATAVFSWPIAEGVTAVLRLEAVGIVTHKGGGAENVGDTYHLNTEVTVKNVGGTISIVTNETEVSVTDADASMALTAYAFTETSTDFVATVTNPSTLNTATVVTHQLTVKEIDFAA